MEHVMQEGVISLRTFILGEVRIWDGKNVSPRYSVEFTPNALAVSRGIKKMKDSYYELNDAQTCSDWYVRNSKELFNANK